MKQIEKFIFSFQEPPDSLKKVKGSVLKKLQQDQRREANYSIIRNASPLLARFKVSTERRGQSFIKYMSKARTGHLTFTIRIKWILAAIILIAVLHPHSEAIAVNEPPVIHKPVISVLPKTIPYSPLQPVEEEQSIVVAPVVVPVATPVYASGDVPTILNAIKNCESSGNYANEDTGHNGHYGAYQFSLSTWASVGGTGDPAQASPAEQDMRATILYNEEGTSPWTASEHCWGG